MTRTQQLGLCLVLFAFSVSGTRAQDSNSKDTQETPAQAKAEAQKPDAQATATDLAKAVQNPVASLVSVPVQNLTDFNIGPFARDRNTVLQFQPVIPIQLGENWNLITRTIGALAGGPFKPAFGLSGALRLLASMFLVCPGRTSQIPTQRKPRCVGHPVPRDKANGQHRLSFGIS